VPDGESPDTAENSLTFALLWLDRIRHSTRGTSAAGLRVIVAKGTSCTLAHRLSGLDPRIPVELYERDASLESLEKIDHHNAGNVETGLVSGRDAHALVEPVRSMLQPILALAPKAIDAHPVPQSREVSLRFRGLPFARWEDGRIYFGSEEPWTELTPNTQSSLKALIQSLEAHRNPLALDTRHALYRAQAERWLESLIREDVTRIDAALDPRFVYAQVFAHAGGEHGILDLLCVTRDGRLAILELKTTEHIHLPLQAMDYWLRVRRHLAQDNISRFGYFPGIELQRASPLVYLVAPALRFHPTTDTLLRYLTPELEVVRVGLAESWRRGLRIVMRQ